MMRTQISLDAEAHRRARTRASELGISFAEYVRRLVDADLAEPTSTGVDVHAVFDLGDGGRTDVARDKDALLGEALAPALPVES
ncbi:MAG: hypothetical protein M5U27_07825 [Gaiella sp.]|nr:hypothetical protein [Gaiella sp.]